VNLHHLFGRIDHDGSFEWIEDGMGGRDVHLDSDRTAAFIVQRNKSKFARLETSCQVDAASQYMRMPYLSP
jgi:hypothetical protein